ncbi:ABC transporter permease [Pseudonocardia sp. EC080610-09]|uniref:ABC transporter permease n=1 Tax=unclassified Pseudonocardia TaxID=2619320 RepID=UPI0006CB32E4|nr:MULTISPECIES: ABC transporter permease [unclassified Pseudonocardia]ALE72855.1 ABC transporter permease [Pseudonocardia sp. EC080625-04]ALL76179.1 ABC transporter permease [Pseudonocardia sp. EC080610-09]ALL83204.1 ABC transporter permease [Pseudonocardia sp. EC080619-01]
MTLTSTDPGPGTAPPERSPARRGRAAARRWAVRIASAVLVVWGAATAAFLAQLAQPGDRATAVLNLRTGQVQERSPDELAPINAEYGFDRSPLYQYLDYLAGLARGDLGTSYQQHRPVWEVISEQVPSTLALSATALVLAWVLMLVWVLLTAGRGPVVSGWGAAVESVLAGLPQYWLGVVLVLVFALGLGWFPVVGGSGPTGLVLPALTLALPLAGFLGQSTRTEFERVLGQPFVLTARLRGSGDLAVRLRHVLRHAALAPLTLTGWALGATISGAVIVETVFTRTGVGRTLVTAVESQDLPIVTGVVVLTAIAYVVINLVLDALYPLIDPRVDA